MQKISSIIPPSPRVTAVDLTTAHPLRSGAPGFGVPVAQLQKADQVSLSPTNQENKIFNELSEPQWKSTDLRRAEMVQRISNDFSLNNPVDYSFDFEFDLDDPKQAGLRSAPTMASDGLDENSPLPQDAPAPGPLPNSSDIDELLEVAELTAPLQDNNQVMKSEKKQASQDAKYLYQANEKNGNLLNVQI